MTIELIGGPCDGERLEYGRFTTAAEAIRRHLADEWICGRQFSGTYRVATECEVVRWAIPTGTNPDDLCNAPGSIAPLADQALSVVRRAHYEQDSAALRGRDTS